MGLLAALVVGGFVSGGLNRWYAAFAAPPGSPPGWVVAPTWTAMSILAGLAAWRVWLRLGASAPLRLWGWQLALGALWAPLVFGLHSPTAGAMVLAALWPVLLCTIQSFRRIEAAAAAMMLPSAATTLYASYLAAGFWWLN